MTSSNNVSANADVVCLVSGASIEFLVVDPPQPATLLRTSNRWALEIFEICKEGAPLDQLRAGITSDDERLLQRMIDAGVLLQSESRRTRVPSDFSECRKRIASLIASLQIYTYDLSADWAGLQTAAEGELAEEQLRSFERDLNLLHVKLQGVVSEVRTAQHKYANQRLQRLDIDERNDLKLNLGSGADLLAGWINLDVASREVPWNLRNGLPFKDGSASHVYMAHVLEHFDYKDEALVLMKEIRRVLRKGGVLRIVVPDMECFLDAYARKDRGFFEYFSKTWNRPVCAGLLESFWHYGGAGSFPGVVDHHRYGYDLQTLAALLREAGFGSVERREASQTDFAGQRVEASWATNAQYNSRSLSLIVDAA